MIILAVLVLFLIVGAWVGIIAAGIKRLKDATPAERTDAKGVAIVFALMLVPFVFALCMIR